MKYEELTKEISEKAYCPYSKFKVGSTVVMEDGRHFCGCNVENASYGATICAERNAIFQAIAAGCKIIKHIYIYTDGGFYPCGMCRQVIQEFADDSTKVTILNREGTKEVLNFNQLFPQGFKKEDLLK